MNSENKEYEVENFYTHTEEELEHYAFVTANDFIDILVLHSPLIQITKMRKNTIFCRVKD